MTSPARILASPSIDLAALEALIEEKSVKAQSDGVQYKTRTQVMLEDREARAAALEVELAAMRGEARRLEEFIERLQKILGAMRVSENDVAVELAVELASVAGLRQAGVTPAKETES